MLILIYLYIFNDLFFLNSVNTQEIFKINYQLTKVWGPGLHPDEIILPARYFFIETIDDNNLTVILPSKDDLKIQIEGSTKENRPCRLWTNILDIKDGTFIVRYKQYESCKNLRIEIKYNNEHIAQSPYLIDNPVYSDDCNCPLRNIEKLLNLWQCGPIPVQINNKLNIFSKINWDVARSEVIKAFDKPLAISLCHYVIKDNEIYRKCYGKYVGFNMFMDSILLSLSRKVSLPDLEFFVNLGDWPLSTYVLNKEYPILSWCGSTDSYDIIMPTYDITESSLENMGRVMLDMLSVQGNVELTWENRIPKLFWRGRDSNENRLKLIDISRENPTLFNVSLTNFFFFRDKEHIYGPKTEHVSFFRFFDYKYQLAIDGTVAAYRMPYLLAGGSLLFKQDSKYKEFYYDELEPNVHYIPVKKDLSDLVEKINEAVQNDDKAKTIAKNGQKFANEHLLPKNILCYYIHILNEFSKRIVSPVKVLEGMEKINQTKETNCDCNNHNKDEL